MEHIGTILSLCKGIVWMVDEVKGNKKRCRRLADRVKVMDEVVETIKLRGPRHISPNVNTALRVLSATLVTAHELIRKCTKTRFPNLIKCKSEFNSMNESLRDIFLILSGALQVEQGNMMHRMFQDYSVEEDDDDWGGEFGPPGPVPYSLAMAPAHYSPASVAPMPYFHAAAPTPQAAATVFVAAMEMDGDTLCYVEGVFHMQ